MSPTHKTPRSRLCGDADGTTPGIIALFLLRFFAVGLKLSSSENGSNTCENVDDGKSTCPIAYVLVCSAQPIYPARWLYDLSVFSICLSSHAIMKACNPRAALPLEQHSRGSRRKKLVRAAINIWVNSACCCQLAISPARFRRRTWQFAT